MNPSEVRVTIAGLEISGFVDVECSTGYKCKRCYDTGIWQSYKPYTYTTHICEECETGLRLAKEVQEAIVSGFECERCKDIGKIYSGGHGEPCDCKAGEQYR